MPRRKPVDPTAAREQLLDEAARANADADFYERRGTLGAAASARKLAASLTAGADAIAAVSERDAKIAELTAEIANLNAVMLQQPSERELEAAFRAGRDAGREQ